MCGRKKDCLNLHAFLILFLFSFVANATEDSCRSTEENAFKTVVTAKANALSATLSALRSLRQGDSELAISTLEADLRSNVTSLYVLLPELSGEKRAMEQTLREAEKYAAENGIKILKPKMQ